MPDTAQIAAYAKLLRLTPVDSPAVVTIETPSLPTSEAQKLPATTKSPARARKPVGIISLLLLVVIPVSLAAGYFWLLAADRYESEARFVLRTPSRPAVGIQMPNLLQSSGVNRSNDDGYLVREYLESRDALAFLERNAGLREAFRVASTDPIWGFPNLFTADSEETLYWHYRRMVSASFDSASGVSTLKVQAFTPEDAHRLTAALLNAAEGLVNRLNERSRRDAVGLADKEADLMRHRALAGQAALTAFREREQLIDPSQETMSVLETIAKLSLEAAQVSVQLGELGKASPDTPQSAPLRARRAALEAQIAVERQRLAGNTQSIASRIAEYERLMLEREFGEKALIAAMTAVEIARSEALRQQVYLERVAAPGRPDYPTYPWRLIWCLGILVASYMIWRIWCAVAADALQHSKL